MKKTGTIILIVGLILILFTGLNFVTKRKVVDIGSVEISTNKNHHFSWSPLIGVFVVAIGAGLYLLAIKKQ